MLNSCVYNWNVPTTSANDRLLELLSSFSTLAFFAGVFSTLFLDGLPFGDWSFFDGTDFSFSCASFFSLPFDCSLRFVALKCSLVVSIAFGSDDFVVAGLAEKNEEIEDFPVCAIGAFAALPI